MVKTRRKMLQKHDLKFYMWGWTSNYMYFNTTVNWKIYDEYVRILVISNRQNVSFPKWNLTKVILVEEEFSWLVQPNVQLKFTVPIKKGERE